MGTETWRGRQIFWREFRRSFHTTGAILPSGAALGRALTRLLQDASTQPRRVLEIGPGSGAVTEHLVSRLRPEDRADLVEINAKFVSFLRERLEQDPRFAPVAAQIQIHEQDLAEFRAEAPYDVAISGLPLNNFQAVDVAKLLERALQLLKPGGTLSFFEYIAIRPARALVSGRKERDRLRGISDVLQSFLRKSEFRREAVWRNMPPAWVHHLRRND